MRRQQTVEILTNSHELSVEPLFRGREGRAGWGRVKLKYENTKVQGLNV